MIGTVRRVICLPTYDERENLEPMVRALGALGLEGLEVLVIDDGSPDGTGEIADRLAAELPWVHVLHRARKEGLGPAYLAGFAQALELGADFVFEMDCDFSHDPADVPRLAAAAEEADLALGSRYVAGGGTRNWGLVRRFISRGGSLYAQVLLQLGIRDLTGGFKCYRRAVLGDDRPGRDRLAGIRVPDRDDVPGDPRRLPRRRGADHVRRPRSRRLEDEQVDRRRGDLESPGPPPPSPDQPSLEAMPQCQALGHVWRLTPDTPEPVASLKRRIRELSETNLGGRGQTRRVQRLTLDMSRCLAPGRGCAGHG